MILELFKYFARYPRKEGVLSMFANGSSTFAPYEGLMEYVHGLSGALVPEIESYVFGQSYEDVKKRIDSITGSFLFVDFGEITSSRDTRNSITDRQKIAITVAMKVSDIADTVEIAIVSDITLSMLSSVRRQLIRESRSRRELWMESISADHEIIPFVAPEFKSIGWTLLFSTSSADLFGVKPSFRE